jgi:hypothetical protein
LQPKRATFRPPRRGAARSLACWALQTVERKSPTPSPGVFKFIAVIEANRHITIGVPVASGVLVAVMSRHERTTTMHSSGSTCCTVIRAAVAGSSSDREELARRYLGVVRAYLAARWRGSAWRDDLLSATRLKSAEFWNLLCRTRWNWIASRPRPARSAGRDRIAGTWRFTFSTRSGRRELCAESIATPSMSAMWCRRRSARFDLGIRVRDFGSL